MACHLYSLIALEGGNEGINTCYQVMNGCGLLTDGALLVFCYGEQPVELRLPYQAGCEGKILDVLGDTRVSRIGFCTKMQFLGFGKDKLGIREVLVHRGIPNACRTAATRHLRL